MKISLEYPVDATVKIGKEIRINRQGKEYSFIPDENGILKAIRITTTAPSPKKVRTKLEAGGNGVDATVTIDIASENLDALVAEFQALESRLSFDTSGALRRIVWSDEKTELLPETEEEAAQAHIRSFHFKREYPKTKVILSEEDLRTLLDTKARYSSLVILESFFREGQNEYAEFKYINAFHNFYYIIEDLYGEGKTKNRDVANALKASKEFRSIMKWALDSAVKEPKHYPALQKLFKLENLAIDIDGFIDLLIRVRGRTHHYTSKGGSRYPTPFKQKDYHSIAWILLGIAVKAILSQIVRINQSWMSGARRD